MPATRWASSRREATFERDRRLGVTAPLQHQPPPRRLEDSQRPVLAISLGRHDAEVGRLVGLLAPVERVEDPYAHDVGEALAGIPPPLELVAFRRGDGLQRSSEVAQLVLHPSLRELKREPARVVGCRVHRFASALLDLQRFGHSAGGREAVVQRGPKLRSQVIRKRRQRQAFTSVLSPGPPERGSNMLATLKRTRPSSSAGSAWRRVESANRLPSSVKPAANSETIRRATSGPRSGWRSGVSSSAFAASSAADAGSVMLRACAASYTVVIAPLSPGSALSMSCAATSTGSAPRASRTSAACRSRARRTGASRLPRTASRIRSCRKTRWLPSSANRSAWMSSPTGSMSSVSDISVIAAEVMQCESSSESGGERRGALGGRATSERASPACCR